MRFNHITLVGRLTRDPELKYAPSGTAICKMRIAYDQGSGDKKTTGFVDVTAFAKIAESAAQYLKKGRAILVGGRLEYREWEADGGGKRSAVEIAAHDLQFLDAPKNEDAPAGEPPRNVPPEW